MDQRLTFITLGVKDLGIMKDFYQNKFGWEVHKEMEGIAFFRLNGFILALYPTTDLASDANIPLSGEGWKRFSFSINFRSQAEVDQQIANLSSRGVNLIKAPQQVFWGGYNAYVEDAEFNLWELAYNPFLVMDAEGNVLDHN